MEQNMIIAAVMQADFATRSQLAVCVAQQCKKLKLTVAGEQPFEPVDGVQGPVTNSIGSIFQYVKAIAAPESIKDPAKPHTYDTDGLARRHYDENMHRIAESRRRSEQHVLFLKRLAASLGVTDEMIAHNGTMPRKKHPVDVQTEQALRGQGTPASQQIVIKPAAKDPDPGTLLSQQVTSSPALIPPQSPVEPQQGE